MQQNRLTCDLWNVVPLDWEVPDAWLERAVTMCRSRPRSLVVLHDTATGAMDQLPRFLDIVGETGGQFRQDFPPDCAPIRNGQIVGSIDQYMTKQNSEAPYQ